MSPKVHIRRAEESDKESLVEFNVAMALETEDISLDRQILSKGVIAIFDNPDYGVYYVAEYSGEAVAGLLITYEWSDWRNGMFWWIQSVYVKPAHRRKGIFKALFQYLEDIIRDEQHIVGLRLYVERNNLAARKTYEELGMQKTTYRLYEKLKPKPSQNNC